MSSPLGFIPNWQFSADPNENPYVNEFVSMPAGVYQAGVFSTQPQWGLGASQGQPSLFHRLMVKVGLVKNGKSKVAQKQAQFRDANSKEFKCLNCPGQFSGTTLGFVMQDEGDPPTGVPWGMIKEGPMVFNRNVEYLRTGNFYPPKAGMQPVAGLSFENPFAMSWTWQHRKALVLTGVGVVGLAALSLLGAFGR